MEPSNPSNCATSMDLERSAGSRSMDRWEAVVRELLTGSMDLEQPCPPSARGAGMKRSSGRRSLGIARADLLTGAADGIARADLQMRRDSDGPRAGLTCGGEGTGEQRRPRDEGRRLRGREIGSRARVARAKKRNPKALIPC